MELAERAVAAPDEVCVGTYSAAEGEGFVTVEMSA